MNNVHDIRNKLFNEIGSNIKKSCLAEVMHGKRMSTTRNEISDIPPSLPSMVAQIAENNPSYYLSNLRITNAQCKIIEAKTRNQSINPIWHEQRKGRKRHQNFIVCVLGPIQHWQKGMLMSVIWSMT